MTRKSNESEFVIQLFAYFFFLVYMVNWSLQRINKHKHDFTTIVKFVAFLKKIKFDVISL